MLFLQALYAGSANSTGSATHSISNGGSGTGSGGGGMTKEQRMVLLTTSWLSSLSCTGQQWLQFIIVLSTLLFAVANAEIMQGIANGTFSPVPYDQPAFLSWSSYNCFLLSWIPLKIGCFYILKKSDSNTSTTMNTTTSSSGSVLEYLRTQWAVGGGGMKRMLMWSCIMQFLLLGINILWVVGLTKITVSASNAIYQLQTGVTVGLSVIWLKHRFVMAEAMGITLSLLGVALIVLPPLFLDDTDNNGGEKVKHSWMGEITTFGSAVLWGFYQVSWELIGKREESGLEGLMDTLATLFVMGAVNLIVGWPMLLILHWTGFETFVWPSMDLWWSLTMNGLVEFAFDSTCAFAIFLTSPVVTSITFPLTIPISLVWDGDVGHYYNWVGSALLLAGVLWMELKVPCCLIDKKYQAKEYEMIPADVV